jgi:hypothetical protein
LRDAANYVKKLSETERGTPEWRLAIQMLIDAAEDRGPMLFAKMGIHRAVNPGRKNPDWGRGKLARDRWNTIEALFAGSRINPQRRHQA